MKKFYDYIFVKIYKSIILLNILSKALKFVLAI